MLSWQLHPFVVGNDEAVLLGIAHEPVSLLGGAVGLALQSVEEVFALHHLLWLDGEDVLDGTGKPLGVIVVALVVVAVEGHEGHADDYDNENRESCCSHTGMCFYG